MFDTIFSGGTVVDGGGAGGFAADVAVRDGKISVIGDLSEAACDERLDVAGLTVTPASLTCTPIQISHWL